MALESGTYVDDLVATNPPGGDDKRQGDDHLRLLKSVLKNTLKRASKAFSFPGVISKSANYTVLSTDDNLTIQCDTTVAFTLTLPTLAVGDAGWAIYVVKNTTDANPVYIAPTSGTINGFSKIRRSAEFCITKVLWTGTIWVASRPFGAPIGSTVKYYGSTLPNGYLWGDGATFTAANFVELNATYGTNSCPDVRGRVELGRDDMGAGAANRVTVGSSGVDATAVRNTGGTQVHVLTMAQLPASGVAFTTGFESATHTHSGTTGAENQTHTHSGGTTGVSANHSHPYAPEVITGSNTAVVAGGSSFATAIANSGVQTQNTGIESADHTHGFTSGTESATHDHGFTTGNQSANHTHSGTTNNLGTGTGHLNIQPSIVCNVIVVAE